MIEIVTSKGDTYSFDRETERTFKNGMFVPKSQVEPVYCGNGKDSEPLFAGLMLKSTNSILTPAGNIKPIVDINSIK